MKKILNIVNWIIGIFFVLMALGTLINGTSGLATLSFSLIAMYFFLPTSAIVIPRTGKKIPWIFRAIPVFILFVIGANALPPVPANSTGWAKKQDDDFKGWVERQKTKQDLEKATQTAKEFTDFNKGYEKYGGPKILYTCGGQLSYSIGTGAFSSYNQLIEDAETKCGASAFNLIKGER